MVICPGTGQDKMVSFDRRTWRTVSALGHTPYSFNTYRERTGHFCSIPREGSIGALWIVVLGGTFWQVFAGFLFEKL